MKKETQRVIAVQTVQNNALMKAFHRVLRRKEEGTAPRL